MPILESTVGGKLAGAVIGFFVLAAGGITDGANIAITGHSILGEIGIPLEGQYTIATVAIAACAFLGKVVLGYHERMLKDRENQIAELHKRVTELEASRDKQSEAILNHLPPSPPDVRESRQFPRVTADH